jgi:hypothetical protein
MIQIFVSYVLFSLRFTCKAMKICYVLDKAKAQGTVARETDYRP